MVYIREWIKCSCGYEREIEADAGILGIINVENDPKGEKCPQCKKKLYNGKKVEKK